jgi:FKBP-type peptidyl-prolyl cis-trans isomerase 2
MCKVKQGSKIKVHYTGQLEDGTVFDSSQDRDPLEFEVGSGQIIPGVDKGVIDMKVGEARKLTIKPEDAYGPSQEDLIGQVDKSAFPDDIDPQIGQQLQMDRSDGDPIQVVVTTIEGDKVTLDANHPLAGQTLVFDVEVTEIL